MSKELAINGGIPVRNTPLPFPFPGAGLFGEEEKKAVIEVLERKSPFRYYGYDVAGKVKNFEMDFSQKIGCRFALGVTSGTAAVIVALKALGIGPGDKVIVPANTFIATAGAVVIAGAVPVFADIDDSMNINPDEIEKLADEHTKAVIAVPILGNACDMDRIMSIAKKNNLFVIEDVAQSCGCRYKGKYAGTFGDISCFSLQINKIITAGEGGIVATNNEKLYERAVRYHDHGMFREMEGFLNVNEEDDIFIGQNYRMNEITGAVAFEQLKKLDYINSRMKEIKNQIKKQIMGIGEIGFRRIIDDDGDIGSALCMILPDKELAAQFRDALNAENISVACLYNGEPVYMNPQIFHQKTADKQNFPFNCTAKRVEYTKNMCPYAEELLPRNASILLSPLLTENDINDIVSGIRKVVRYLL